VTRHPFCPVCGQALSWYAGYYYCHTCHWIFEGGDGLKIDPAWAEDIARRRRELGISDGEVNR
jgi:hypothetical protein